MKKQLFSWMTIALMAVVCVGFAACGGDGDGGSGTGSGSSSLSGKWKKISEREARYQLEENGKWIVTEDEGEKASTSGSGFIFDGKNARLVYFNSDGSYTLETDDLFEFKVQDGHLYLLELDEHDTDGFEDYGAINITGNEFTLVEEKYYSGSQKKVKTKRYRKI